MNDKDTLNTDLTYNYLMAKATEDYRGVVVQTSMVELGKFLKMRAANTGAYLDALVKQGRIEKTDRRGQWRINIKADNNLDPVANPWEYINYVLSADTLDGTTWILESFLMDRDSISTDGVIEIVGMSERHGEIRKRIRKSKMLSYLKTPKKFYNLLTDWVYSCGEPIAKMTQQEWSKGFRRALMEIMETKKLPHIADAQIKRDIAVFLAMHPAQETSYEDMMSKGAYVFRAADFDEKFAWRDFEDVESDYVLASFEVFYHFAFKRRAPFDERLDMDRYKSLLEGILEDEIGVVFAYTPYIVQGLRQDFVLLPPVEYFRQYGMFDDVG